MDIAVYNQNGEKIGTTLLPKEIFEVEVKPDMLHQVVVAQAANRRKIIAHTKTRGDVRGGGRKPWRQKGTGRARHGSRRSPIWVGGGVAFGPTKDRIFTQKINKKMKRSALSMVLSAKVKNNLLFVLDKIELKGIKTKIIAQILKKFPIKGTKLIVLPQMDKNLIASARNIAEIATMQARDLNALDLLSFKYVIILKDAIVEILRDAKEDMGKKSSLVEASRPTKAKKIVKTKAKKKSSPTKK